VAEGLGAGPATEPWVVTGIRRVRALPVGVGARRSTPAGTKSFEPVHPTPEDEPASDTVAVEEPLEVRIGGDAGRPGTPFAVVMRTPGDDFDLAWGLAVTEQIVRDPSAIASAHWGDPADFNAVELRLGPGEPVPDLSGRRPWLSTASCGLCGKDTIAAIAATSTSLHGLGRSLSPEALVGLPDRLREHQGVFDRTGGLHGAGAFTPDGEPVCVREDIGRHNALDKVVGHLARRGMLPAHDLVMVVSGRTGFEIVQKAAAAGVPSLVSVSAPSSLAVQLAASLGMTLAGFVRNGGANLYCGYERLRPGPG